jgi:hypothetical protein
VSIPLANGYAAGCHAVSPFIPRAFNFVFAHHICVVAQGFCPGHRGSGPWDSRHSIGELCVHLPSQSYGIDVCGMVTQDVYDGDPRKHKYRAPAADRLVGSAVVNLSQVLSQNRVEEVLTNLESPARVHAYTHTHTHTYIHTCTHTHTYTHTQTHTRTHAHAHTRTHTLRIVA